MKAQVIAVGVLTGMLMSIAGAANAASSYNGCQAPSGGTKVCYVASTSTAVHTKNTVEIAGTHTTKNQGTTVTCTYSKSNTVSYSAGTTISAAVSAGIKGVAEAEIGQSYSLSLTSSVEYGSSISASETFYYDGTAQCQRYDQTVTVTAKRIVYSYPQDVVLSTKNVNFVFETGSVGEIAFLCSATAKAGCKNFGKIS